MNNQVVLRRSALAQALALAIALPLAPAVFAQNAAQADREETQEEKKEEAQTLDKITVTGSLISRFGFDSVSPVQIITADTSTTVGQLDTTTILQTTNVASGSTQISNQFSGFVIEGGNGVQTLALRGLGANRTLVLLDGRRPGPAGTRGQVGAFDLNVIPSIILQRAEILKDGGGSIYGSDAVAGVVNLITRKVIDRPELNVDANLPFESGGSRFNVSGATGWNFDNGSVVAAFQYYQMQPLQVGDRDFFRCNYDLVRDANGNLLPFEDRSITRGTPNEGCINFGIINAVDDLTLPAANRRYGPSPDGVQQGPIPGYRLVRVVNANPAAGTPAFYEQQFYLDFQNEAHIFSAQERLSLFTAADFSFDRVDWSGQFLYTGRETRSRRFRQFFPVVDARPYGFNGLARPIVPFRSDQNIDVDFYYLSSSFRGDFGSDSSWTWNFDTTFSRSDGEYSSLGIDRDRTGDLLSSPDRRPNPTVPINYFDPRILSGEGMEALTDAIGQWHTGNTVYDQFVVNATTSGDLFRMPAGMAAGAIGAEFRRISINDTPSDLERTGGLWGQSSAIGTKGKDYVYETFGEIELPLLAGLPGVEQLTFNGSARMFKYDTVADSDYVWKAGLGWQIVPSVRLRATNSTSYRAPGLYELFLGDQTGFLGQLQIDPCVRWGESSNPNIQANCAAAGIPADYDGLGSSATIVTGGGLGVLKPETSKAFTAGIVFTPAFANLSMSVDYFKIQVNDQIDRLGAANIVGSCYALPVFPNAFCNLFTRNPGNLPTGAYNIATVRDSYININKQVNRGYDLNVRWDGDFSFGKIELESQVTYTIEDLQLLFDSAEPSGYESDDLNGIVTRPKLVGNLRSAFKRGDWTYTWFMRYVDSTENFFVNPIASYRGTPNAVYDIKAESRLYHGLSVRYQADKWNILVGVDNLFDKDPPTISNGGGSTRYGTIPAFATQYDWFGRSAFFRFGYRF
ncbi:MAG: TonB-dependent receptor domain-containing protein [Rehaibacterium terrae]|uniref:TonB-dependent receptor domain-containing protein n=1 Tax=Rehaibacterium terrae TaxID=1341696 RepID=UPI003919857A